MAESEGQGKAKKGRRKPGDSKGPAGSNGWGRGLRPLFKALRHPLRRKVLDVVNTSEDSISSSRIQRVLAAKGIANVSVSTIVYHVSVLESLGLVECGQGGQDPGQRPHGSRMFSLRRVREALDRARGSDEATP
jgi:DNA-binding transcriptional ArsR family regulator